MGGDEGEEKGTGEQVGRLERETGEGGQRRQRGGTRRMGNVYLYIHIYKVNFSPLFIKTF